MALTGGAENRDIGNRGNGTEPLLPSSYAEEPRTLSHSA